jgi:hypothetical protein
VNENETGETCRWNEQAVAYALHALEPDEETALQGHLAGCRSCQATVAETEVVAAALGGTVEQVDPPPGLRQSILDEIAQTPQVGTAGVRAAGAADAGAPERGGRGARGPAGARPAGTGRGPGGPGRRRRRLVVAALALAAVVGVAGVGGLAAYAVQVQQERDAQIAQSQALADVLVQVGRPGTTHATLATSGGEPVGAVVTTPTARMVVTDGLPANDRGTSIYVLWGIGTTPPQPIGTFDVEAAPEPGVHQLGPAGAGQPFLGYAISLEPGRSAPASPTTVVASGQVPT